MEKATWLWTLPEGKTRSGKDRFTLDQVVFTYKDFMDVVLKLKPGKIIVFDEPSVYLLTKIEIAL